MGEKLTEYELKLYEYSAFSLMEEVDIFFIKAKNKEEFVEKQLTKD